MSLKSLKFKEVQRKFETNSVFFVLFFGSGINIAGKLLIKNKTIIFLKSKTTKFFILPMEQHIFV
jgi:hypothetical protein